MKLIHYSPEIIEYLEPITYDQNLSWRSKPIGLWVSVEHENSDMNWKEWCEGESFQLENLKYAHEITLKKDATIFYIKTPEELFSFTREYPYSTRTYDIEYDTYKLNWNKISEEYQGIIITPYLWECRLSIESSWYYCWDCSSGCIWDLTCIDKFELI